MEPQVPPSRQPIILPRPTAASGTGADASNHVVLAAAPGELNADLKAENGFGANFETQIKELQNLLQKIDERQAGLTEQYIEFGRRLRKLSDQLKEERKHLREERKRLRKLGREPDNKLKLPEFKRDVLQRFVGPHRSISTLGEYMTLARRVDEADNAQKVQLAGLFPQGWGAVLRELRKRKKVDRNRRQIGQWSRSAPQGDDLTLLQGDCMQRLKDLPDESVDCVITSIPYYRTVLFPDTAMQFGGKSQCPTSGRKIVSLARSLLPARKSRARLASARSVVRIVGPWVGRIR